jgi:hypothetical protein
LASHTIAPFPRRGSVPIALSRKWSTAQHLLSQKGNCHPTGGRTCPPTKAARGHIHLPPVTPSRTQPPWPAACTAQAAAPGLAAPVWHVNCVVQAAFPKTTDPKLTAGSPPSTSAFSAPTLPFSWGSRCRSSSSRRTTSRVARLTYISLHGTKLAQLLGRAAFRLITDRVGNSGGGLERLVPCTFLRKEKNPCPSTSTIPTTLL